MRRISVLLIFAILVLLFTPAKPVQAQEGVTWEPAPMPGLYGENITAFTPNPVIQDLLFLGSNENGLYRSVDGGKTWLVVLGPEYLAPVTAIAADHYNGRTIYASGQPGGVFRSDDAGETWQKVGGETFNGVAAAIATHPYQVSMFILPLTQAFTAVLIMACIGKTSA